MGEIVIVKKPDSVSFEDIHELLYQAHQVNRDNGFTIGTGLMSGEQLQEHLGENSVCFVAMDGDKVVGTTSNRVRHYRHWCAEGDVVERVMTGVLPEYKGRHIYEKLNQAAVQDARERGVRYLEVRAADQNHTILKLNLRNGFKKIDFTTAGKDHYTVILLKWLDRCPYPDWFIKFRYELKRIYIKLRYKPGKIKRFGI